MPRLQPPALRAALPCAATLGNSRSLLFAGGTLAEFIHKRCNSLLDEDTILHFFVQIVLALHHVHTKQILHRDLKTQNILLDKHRMIVKIGDFGISKILSSKSKAYTVSGLALQGSCLPPWQQVGNSGLAHAVFGKDAVEVGWSLLGVYTG